MSRVLHYGNIAVCVRTGLGPNTFVVSVDGCVLYQENENEDTNRKALEEQFRTVAGTSIEKVVLLCVCPLKTLTQKKQKKEFVTELQLDPPNASEWYRD